MSVKCQVSRMEFQNALEETTYANIINIEIYLNYIYILLSSYPLIQPVFHFLIHLMTHDIMTY